MGAQSTSWNRIKKVESKAKEVKIISWINKELTIKYKVFCRLINGRSISKERVEKYGENDDKYRFPDLK